MLEMAADLHQRDRGIAQAQEIPTELVKATHLKLSGSPVQDAVLDLLHFCLDRLDHGHVVDDEQGFAVVLELGALVGLERIIDGWVMQPELSLGA
jgi:hypothetical protein